MLEAENLVNMVLRFLLNEMATNEAHRKYLLYFPHTKKINLCLLNIFYEINMG